MAEYNADESETDEEIVVVLDDSYTSHSREELVAEIVTYVDDDQPPPPTKSAFDRYNDQLRASMSKPKSNPVSPGKLPKESAPPPPPASPMASPEPEKPKSNASSLDTSSHHSRKGAAGWWGAKKKLSWRKQKTTPSSDPPPPPASPATSPEPEPPKSNSSSLGSNSSHQIKKGAAGWWGVKRNKNRAKSNEVQPITSVGSKPSGSKLEVIQSVELTVSPSKMPPKKVTPSAGLKEEMALGDSKLPETPALATLREAIESKPTGQQTATEGPDKAAETPKAESLQATKAPGKVNRSSWVKSSSAEEPPPAEPTTPKKMPGKITTPNWVKSKESAECTPSEVPAPKRTPGRVTKPSWVTAKVKAEPPLDANSKTESLKGGSSDEPPGLIPTSSGHTSGDSSIENSSHHKEKMSIPWLKSEKPDPSDEEPDSDPAKRGSSPPPPVGARPWQKRGSPETSPKPSPTASPRGSPKPHKSLLVNRYLNAASTNDDSEHARRMAQIEADRARGRWDGSSYVQGGRDDVSDGKTQKDWNYLKQKSAGPSQKELEEAAAIKIQAMVRGFCGRRRVMKYVDELIAEMMRKMDAAKQEQMTKRLKVEEEERRKIAEKDEKLRQEEMRKRKEREELRRKETDEERRKREAKEEAEIRRRMHDQRYGLPLWWLELIPHKTMSQKEYQAKIKKDNGFHTIDYRVPVDQRKKPLAIVAEDDGEVDDENDANLDKIIGRSSTSGRKAGPQQTKKTVTKPKKKTGAQPKKKAGFFSKFGNSKKIESAPRAAAKQESAPRVATKK